MRILFTSLIAVSLAAHVNVAAADPSTGTPSDPRPQPPVVDPLPTGPELRGTAPVIPVAMLLPAVQAAREAARNATADEAIDMMLGALPSGPAAADGQGARHIYVDENGDLACVTLDTFFPEPC